jgi:hypothetical protein
MSAVLPIGFVTLLEGAERLQATMHAGLPDSPIVKKFRQGGFDVNDGPATDSAIDELWKAVDKGTLRCVAIGGRPRRVVRLSPQFTRSIPGLRSPRGRGFTLLRQSNPAYRDMASWFGPLFHTATAAFRETEIEKLGRRLMRARRTVQRTNGPKKKARGRRSLIVPVQQVIRDVVGRRKWNPTMPMKALTSEVNRSRECQRVVSDETVTRALDGLHEQTGDRRFERVRRARRARKSRS